MISPKTRNGKTEPLALIRLHLTSNDKNANLESGFAGSLTRMDKSNFLEELKRQSPLPNMDSDVFDALRQLVPMIAVEFLVIRVGGEFGLKKKKVGETEGWSLPGGFVGLNETFEKAGERIVQKELGIIVTELKFLNVFNWPEGGARLVKGHAVTLLFHCLTQDPSDRIVYFRQIPEGVLSHHKIMLEYALER